MKQKFLSVSIIALVLALLRPLPAFTQESCAAVFLKEKDFTSKPVIFSEIQRQLFSIPREVNKTKITQEALEEIQELEKLFGIPYPPEQKIKLLNEMIEKATSDEYLILIHGPDSKAAVLEASKISYDAPAATAFFGQRLNLIDDAYLNNSRTSHSTKLQSVNASATATFLIGQSRKPWNGNKKSTSTLRVFKRTTEQSTIIESFIQEHQITLPLLENLIRNSHQQFQDIFEIGRVSNGTGNRKIMLAQRMLLNHYFAKPSPTALFLLSATSEKLVEYYKKWGFDIVGSWQDPESHKTYFFMAATGKEISESLARDLNFE